ncbi:hypothetical protein N9Q05_01630, partial [bacterium]|nr:hypothetical protein [bacterium]
MSVVEWALRAAMQNISGNETGDLTGAFKDAATKQLNLLMPGDSAEKSAELEILEGALVGVAVVTAVAVMGGIYHWNYTKKMRLQLSQEVDAHGATYRVPKNISLKTLPRKHAFI